MIKIFVTGDNHIGLKYDKYTEKEYIVNQRFDAFDAMVENANKEQCDLFIITGDLFDKTRILKKYIKRVVDSLKRFNEMVVVLPGNHDYYDSNVQVWNDFEEYTCEIDNILLLKEYRPYEIECGEHEVILYPALCQTLHSEVGENNLGWIKKLNIDDDSKYHIGIAHGAVEGETIDNDEKYFVMTREELNAIPVDAWLIGHTHVPFPRNLGNEYQSGYKIFNAGTHVQTHVNNNTEGQCFIIEIDEDKTVKSKKFVSGNFRFYRKNIALEPDHVDEILQSELDKLDQNCYIDLKVEGTVTLDEFENVSSLIEQKLKPFKESRYDISCLSKMVTQELIDKEFAETTFSAKLLNELIDNPREAHLVYDLLNELKGAK